jgi:hypothetical protein
MTGALRMTAEKAALSLAKIAVGKRVADRTITALHAEGFLRQPKAERQAITCKGLALYVATFGSAKPSDIC